ncbi:MAG: hypothetical protein ACYSTY_05030, partial [Planctomycetota bacterium]
MIAIEPAGSATDEVGLLRLAAAVEMPSEHPIARAIVAEAQRRGLDVPDVSDFEAVPGQGVRGRVDGHRVEVGRSDEATCEVLVDGERAGTLTIAAVTFAAWWLLGDLATGVIATVTVLIISCPCALGL